MYCQIFANPDGEAKKKEAVKLLQVRTHAKLLAKEGALKQKQEDLDSQRAEFEQEKRQFYEKRAELYCNFNILQEDMARNFRNLDQRFNEFEEAKLKSAIDVLNKLIAAENEKTSHAELSAKTKMTKEQLEETNGRLTAIAKRLPDFFHTKEEIPKDLQAAVTRCEVEYLALMEEEQQQHDATTNRSAHDTGRQEVSSYFSTGRLEVPTGSKDNLVIITSKSRQPFLGHPT